MSDPPRIELKPGKSVPVLRVRQQIARYYADGDWPVSWGPPPGSPRCLVPAQYLPQRAASGREHGLVSFSGGKPRVTFYGLDSMPAVPPRNDIVAGLFEAGELVMLVGAPKAGKSALAVHLTRAVASGTPFLGRATRRAAVAYAALERPRETVRRLRAAGVIGTNVIVSVDQPALSDAEDVDQLIEALEKASDALPPDLPLGLIIVDTARKAFRGLRENDADSVSIGLEALRRLLRAIPTAAVVLIHHLGKDGSSARGSSAILADADLELTVVNRNGRCSVEVTGANSVEEGQTLGFVLTPLSDPDGSSVIGVADAPASLPSPSREVTRPGSLPRDANTAYRVLQAIATSASGPILRATWRQDTIAAFGDRADEAMRVAWSKARRVLKEHGLVVENGLFVSLAVENGQHVSASDACERNVSAYEAEALAEAVSAPPSIGGGAYAAYGLDRDEPDATS